MKMSRTLVLCLVLGAVAPAYASGVDVNGEFIVGGNEVAANDPVATSTVLITDGNFICSGSIIAKDMVVTAAHCVNASAADLRVVFARTLEGLQKSQVLPITGFRANPAWKGDASSGVDQGDIAVIRLNGALPAGYAPAKVGRKVPKQGDTALLAGFGITDAQTKDGAGTLREVNVTVSSTLGQTEVVVDQTDGKGACHGDSGGPAFAVSGGKITLWGVTNRGYPDNAPDDCVHYAVYTRIAAYASWIASTEAELRAN